MEYRKEIDGLRAIAVVSVILFHAGFASWSGGFVGVDVFFVLSGYLITSIILKDLDDGTFSLARFYERRARRILPALFLVMLCCLPFAWTWMTPGEFEAFSKSLITAALSVSNFYFWRKSDYFAPDAETSPLLHTWSLGVEEQFYLLFPLLVMLLWRKRRGRLAPVLAVVAFASLLLSQWTSQNAPSAGFYMLPTRVWELLAGALVALRQRNLPVASGARANLLAAVGLTLIVFSAFYFDERTPFPSFHALIPIAGTMLVLQSARKGTFVARLLSLPPFVGIGLISYSAYLWHQPVLAFLRINRPDDPSNTAILAACGATFALAFLSWRYVEQPFRRGTIALLRERRHLGGAGAAVASLIVAFGFVGVYTDGLEQRMPPRVQAFLADASWSRKCLFQRGDEWTFPRGDCIFNGGKPQRFAIWGDSVSASIAPTLARRLGAEGIELHQFTHGHCAPILGVVPEGVDKASDCGVFNADAYRHIVGAGMDGVVLFASWANFFDREGYLIDGGGVSGPAGVAEPLVETLRGLREAGVQVILVYPHPVLPVRVGEAAAMKMLRGDPAPDVEQEYRVFRIRAALSYALLDRAAEPSIARVYPEQSFCNQFALGKCVMVNDGVPFLADRLHFTAAGAELVVDQIMKNVKQPQLAQGPAAPAAVLQ